MKGEYFWLSGTAILFAALLTQPASAQLQSLDSLLSGLGASDVSAFAPSLGVLSQGELSNLTQAFEVKKRDSLCSLLGGLPVPSLPSFCSTPPPAAQPPPPITPPAPCAAPPLSPVVPPVPPPPAVVPVPAPSIAPAPAPSGPSCASAFSIDLTSNQADTACCFGFGEVATLGQSFTAPACGSVSLSAFGFAVTAFANIQFQAYLYQWSGSAENGIVGPALFSTDLPVGQSYDAEIITVNLPVPVQLTPGVQYIVLLNAVEGTFGGGQMYLSGAPYYDGGQFFIYVDSAWAMYALDPNQDLSFFVTYA